MVAVPTPATGKAENNSIVFFIFDLFTGRSDAPMFALKQPCMQFSGRKNITPFRKFCNQEFL
jgi:hypothetical protein